MVTYLPCLRMSVTGATLAALAVKGLAMLASPAGSTQQAIRSRQYTSGGTQQAVYGRQYISNEICLCLCIAVGYITDISSSGVQAFTFRRAGGYAYPQSGYILHKHSCTPCCIAHVTFACQGRMCKHMLLPGLTMGTSCPASSSTLSSHAGSKHPELHWSPTLKEQML